MRVDVRVISATTRDLAREVQAGRFRTELFHRLNVVPVGVPGLEARREDIPELAGTFLDELNATQGLPQRVARRPRRRRSCRPCAGPATSASSATRWSGR